MTLGTNASLEEQIKYAPQEVDYDSILDKLKELREWRLLGDTPSDVKEYIDGMESDLSDKEREIEVLELKVLEDENEIEFLKTRIDELEDLDQSET